MLKLAARKEFLEKRKNLTASECLKWDDLLLIQFQKLDWANVSSVANFYPLENHNEPNSLLFTRYLKWLIPGIQMVYPVVDAATATISFYKETEEIRFNNWGIAEPISTEKLEPHSIDAVIVPLIGFDLKGHRIGYGKGFYDRYLLQCRPDCLKIGISLFDPIALIEDVESYDIPLDIAICPAQLYDFR